MLNKDKEKFLNLLVESLKKDSFIKLTLGKYRGSEKGLEHIYIRLIEIKKIPKLSLLYRYTKKDTVKNYSIEDGTKLISELLGSTFYSAHLFTLTQDTKLEYNKKLETLITQGKPVFTEIPSQIHNKEKERIIKTHNNIYLRKLGITNNKGEIREKQGDKFRQINKFIEIISDVLRSSQITSKKDISIVDMGSGKGYLTFALYDYFNNIIKINAKMVGIEQRDDLVKICNDIAQEAQFANLHFIQKLIQDYKIEKVDIVMALHACDTATDDAIFKGISSGANIIICAPCCHKQIRPQIYSSGLSGILQYGILLERQAVLVTDSLRALLLELHGYKTKVLEFISTEHTDKNIMIIGVKNDSRVDRERIIKEIESIKNLFGIKEHYLEHLLIENKK